ncbi:MAG: hypothetical protein K0R51_86 [Cytophagaceae bacterium]|jgi:hypothetical protein|nr:hypothetical protein [Cytophagaceae bacterium]
MTILYAILPTASSSFVKYVTVLLLALSLGTCYAQKKTAVKEQGDVMLNFIPLVEGEAFFMDSIYSAPGGEQYKITNWKFFVSNIAFSTSFGVEQPVAVESKLPVLLIDFGKANTTGVQSIVKVQTGAYTDVRFDIGLPRQINHSDPTMALPPLDLAQQDMYWEWNSGYIFLLVEGQLISTNERFHFAIGGDNKIMPFAHGNLFNITPLVQVEKNKITQLNFTFDFNKLLKNGDGSAYSLNSEKKRIVHGGYFADILSLNAKYAMEFKSVEVK